MVLVVASEDIMKMENFFSYLSYTGSSIELFSVTKHGIQRYGFRLKKLRIKGSGFFDFAEYYFGSEKEALAHAYELVRINTKNFCEDVQEFQMLERDFARKIKALKRLTEITTKAKEEFEKLGIDDNLKGLRNEKKD